MSTQQLIAEAIELPVEDRAHLFNSLLNSVNLSSKEIDRQWLGVARKRLSDDLPAGSENWRHRLPIFSALIQPLTFTAE